MSTAERLAIALERAKKFVDDASHRLYDGTDGHRIRDEARRCSVQIELALAAYRSTPADGGGQGVTPLSDERIMSIAFEQRFVSGAVSGEQYLIAIVRAVEAELGIGTPASTGGEQ